MSWAILLIPFCYVAMHRIIVWREQNCYCEHSEIGVTPSNRAICFHCHKYWPNADEVIQKYINGIEGEKTDA